MAGRVHSGIVLSRLNWRTSAKELRDYFSNFGNVYRANVVMNKEKGMNTGLGFVEFSREEATEAVLEQRQHVIDNTNIVVKPNYAKQNKNS